MTEQERAEHLAAKARRKALHAQPGKVFAPHPAKALRLALQATNVIKRGPRKAKTCEPQPEPMPAGANPLHLFRFR